MISKEGFNGLIKSVSQSSSINANSQPTNSLIGRVIDIIMDENHPLFKDLGEYQSIGTIRYESVGNNSIGTSSYFAKPLTPQLKNYPLIGELVLLFSIPTPLITSSTSTGTTSPPIIYYTTSINVWNSPHHNALPNPLNTSNTLFNSPLNDSQTKFIERDNVNPLLPFTGDIIYEGRNGQSIRFGSTSPSKSITSNPWSDVGEIGQPITIIRNGQSPTLQLDGFIPITEDINNDLSSIYLTSHQKLKFNNETISKFTKFNSLGRATTLNNYTNPQITLTSDRIIMIARNDSILIGSRKNINLSTDEFVNIKSKNLFIDAKNVLLGDENASESLILGDEFMKSFDELLTGLNSLCMVLKSEKSWPGGTPTPNTPLNLIASNLQTRIEVIKSKIQTSKFVSKTSKTI